MTDSLPRLHAVTDDRVVAAGAVAERAGAMAEAAGPDLAVHVRARLEGRALLELAVAVRDAIAPHGAWLVVNGRADVARAAQARAVVSGRGGLTAADIRAVYDGVPVGRSVHDVAGARAAAAEGADFVIAGAVFATASHPGAEPQGIALVQQAAKMLCPVIGIGGMTPGNAGEVVAAGAWGVAAISALWDAPRPAAAARDFLAAFRHAAAPAAAGAAVQVQVNGEPRRFRAGLSLSELLGELGLDARAVVVEHNRRIVRREGLAAARLGEGDTIELVHFVGGG